MDNDKLLSITSPDITNVTNIIEDGDLSSFLIHSSYCDTKLLASFFLEGESHVFKKPD